MIVPNTASLSRWSLLQKIVFRFFFIYFILYTSPWDSLNMIPGIKWLIGLYNQAIEWMVITANEHIFHVFGIRHVKPVSNGSGDTSFQWASLCFMLSLAAVGAVVWSVADRKRPAYRQLNYLLCLVIRYTLALIAFTYGMDKVLALQMPFPLTSQLATPLGDLLPMRLSWLFIGYSTPYQVFSGVLEITVALLLLFRRTATLGTMLGTAVFLNVMMLNLCYDIPVKIYSIHLFLACLYLLANEYKRISCFFFLNRPAPGCSVYDYRLPKKWMRITRIVIKAWVVYLLVYAAWSTSDYYRQYNKETKPLKELAPGYYNVTSYAINRDTLPALVTDSIRWKDFIVDRGTNGSIGTRDTLFRQRYGRGYFYFEADSLLPVLHFYKADREFLSLSYLRTDGNTLQLRGLRDKDSLFVELKRADRKFPLADRSFHWLSEANR